MNSLLIIRQPKTIQELESMYDLRWQVLRKPWNQPRGSEKDQLESMAFQYIALYREQVVGTVRLHKLKDQVAQVRYLAVDEVFRGRGIAGRLMETIHLTAKNMFLKYLILNARETAVKFFEKIGYTVVGDGPLLFGEIKHKKMMMKFSRMDMRMHSIIDNLMKTLK